MPKTMQLVSLGDDDVSIREALGRSVASEGYTVEMFASARAFLDAGTPGRVFEGRPCSAPRSGRV